MNPADLHKDIPGNPSTAKSSKIQLREEATPNTLRVLTIEEWNFWKENGFIVIKNAVPKSQAAETAAFIWEFEEKNPVDPDTWYTPPRAEMQMKELAGTGMVEVYNHQHLWNNRQFPKIYDAFVDIWGTEKLWVTILNIKAFSIGIMIRRINHKTFRASLHWPIKPMKKWEVFNVFRGFLIIMRNGKKLNQRIAIDSCLTSPA